MIYCSLQKQLNLAKTDLKYEGKKTLAWFKRDEDLLYLCKTVTNKDDNVVQ